MRCWESFLASTFGIFWWKYVLIKVSFFGQCSKMQLIPIKKFIIKTWFIPFLWFFRLKCWLKGQMISRIHLSLPNAYKLMCFDRNINGNRDDKFFDWDYWSLHWWKKTTLVCNTNMAKDSTLECFLKFIWFVKIQHDFCTKLGLCTVSEWTSRRLM